jgi:hypothetical protein
MALVNIKTGKGRQKFVEFVVVGDEDKGCKLGDIRWVWWDRSKSSPMLKVEWTSKERIHVKEIRLHADYLRRGWRLLRDMYAEDTEKAHHFADFEAFAQAQVQNPVGMKGEPFPEDRLPVKLQEMRSAQRKAEAEKVDFVFPSDGKGIMTSDERTELDEARAQLGLPPKDKPGSEEEPKQEPKARGRKRIERAQG